MANNIWWIDNNLQGHFVIAILLGGFGFLCLSLENKCLQGFVRANKVGSKRGERSEPGGWNLSVRVSEHMVEETFESLAAWEQFKARFLKRNHSSDVLNFDNPLIISA